VRAEHVPRAVGVFFQLLPEEIRDTNTREYIMCLHAVVAIIGTNLQELGHIPMPYVKVEGNRALAHAQLIHRNGGIIGELDPLEHSACYALKSTYIAPYGTHLTQVNTHATSVLRDLGKVVYRTIDTDKVIRHHINKTTRELTKGLTSIAHRGRCHSHLQLGENIVNLGRPLHSMPLGHRKVHGNTHKHLLGTL